MTKLLHTCLLFLQNTYLEMQSRAREEQGVESTDFGELRSPFQLQMLARVQALEITDT